MADVVSKGKALVAKLRANPKVRDAEALAANLGRRKKLRSAGVAGKKAASLAAKKGGIKEGGASSRADKGRKLARKPSGDNGGMKKLSDSVEKLAPIEKHRELVKNALSGSKEERDKRLDGWVNAERESKLKELAKMAKSNPEGMKRVLDAPSTPSKGNPADGGRQPIAGSSGDIAEITGGTDRQNKYASDLRSRMLRSIDDFLERGKTENPSQFAGLDRKSWLESNNEGAKEIREALRNTDPRYWIDTHSGQKGGTDGLRQTILRIRAKKK